MKNSIITIGTFDGVHKGHQEILRRVVQGAHRTGYTSIALVFTYPPKHVLNPQKEPLQLSLWCEKKKFIRAIGIDKIIPLVFSRSLSGIDPRKFFKKVIRHYQVREIAAGFNFAFGRNRQGHTARLRSLGKEFGIKIHIVPSRMYEGEVISSSSIRTCVRHGYLRKASAMLGYHYQISGIVIHGRGWGKRHDIPTANLHVSQKKLLPQGIFIALLKSGNKSFPSVASIGYHPTIHPVTHLLPEVHILNKKISLYGKQVKLVLLKKIRNEKYFHSTRLMLKTMHHDIRQAEQYFKKIMNL